MAKNKRATALFEVMSKAKLPNNKPGGGLPTPKWWFRSTNRSEVRTLAPGQTSIPISPPPAEPPPAESAEVPVYPADVEDDPTMRPPRPERERAVALTSSMDVPDSTPTVPSPRVQPVEVSVDPKSQLISLRLSYTSALIGGFGFLIVIGIAILIGKAMSRGPNPAIANADTRTLRQAPPTPGVMDVGRRPAGTPTGSNDVIEGQGARPTRGGSTGTRNPQQPSFNDPKPPATFFTDDPTRSNNLNYVIVQSFPNRETAAKASEFLTRNGIPCTVERDLPKWPLPWKDGCVVVGIRGFDKIGNNPELEAYKRTIKELGVKFAGGKGRFNAFDDPRMYKWDKPR